VDAAVACLENSAGGSADVVEIGIARHSGDRSRAIADRPDVTELRLAIDFRTDLRLLRSSRIGDREESNRYGQ
jgi:hypothetical protein